jgi:hypothetical protein
VLPEDRRALVSVPGVIARLAHCRAEVGGEAMADPAEILRIVMQQMGEGSAHA